MEILQTLVEMPESTESIGFKDPISGTQYPMIGIIRSKQVHYYKLIIIFITSLHDKCDCKLETEINVSIHFKYSGPPLQPSDLFSLYWISSTAAKNKMCENKLFKHGTPIINWQLFPVQTLDTKMQLAIEKMNIKSN